MYLTSVLLSLLRLYNDAKQPALNSAHFTNKRAKHGNARFESCKWHSTHHNFTFLIDLPPINKTLQASDRIKPVALMTDSLHLW